MGGTGALQAYLLPLPPTSMPPPPDTMGRHTDTTRQSLMGAAGATNLTPQHTARSPLPKTAHGGREEGDTGISISIVSPPPPHTHTQEHRGTTKAHSKVPALLLQGGGRLGRAGAQGWGGEWGGRGGDSMRGWDPAGCDGTGMLNKEGTPTRRRGGWGGGCTLLGALLESSS